MNHQNRWRSAAIIASLLLPAAAHMIAQPADGALESARIRYVTVLVRNYDEALHWYTDVLGMEKVEDQAYGPAARWLVVAPSGQKDFGIILEVAGGSGMKAMDHDYTRRVGVETNWILEVPDCRKAYETLSKRGVKFFEEPKDQVWGKTQARFQDLYGNDFVLESSGPAKGSY